MPGRKYCLFASILIAATSLSISSAVAQPVHNVTQGTDHATIQAAINAALPGDEIVADPGTYFESIDFLNKDILLRSTDPLDPAIVQATIIDGTGQWNDPIVTLSAGTLSGFTLENIVNFLADVGGVDASGTALVTHNIIRNNWSIYVGGVWASGSAVVTSNIISGNIADPGFGGGTALAGGVYAGDDALIAGNIIEGNGTLGGLGLGSCPAQVGGILAEGNARVVSNVIRDNAGKTCFAAGIGAAMIFDSVQLVNNTITGNSVDLDDSGELNVRALDESVIANNVFAFNEYGIDADSTVTITHNLFHANTTGDGDTGANPIFSDPQLQADGIHISLGSPCFNAGSNSHVQVMDVDIDSESRIQLGIVDVGADEGGDCNGNGIADWDDIAAMTSEDCDENGIPDECQPDCNHNGQADACEPDCNTNGVVDDCDIDSGASADCNVNTVPDECEEDFLCVPAMWGTIQAAIDASKVGDIIYVAPGVYFETIDFGDKDITVQSLDPLRADYVSATIIDGGYVDTVVTLSAGAISGFTIQNGLALGPRAGGVEAGGTAEVSHNVITGNLAEQRGGGVSATDSVVVHNNTITGNVAANRAGGVNARDNAIVINNVISNNHAIIGGGGLRAQENALVRNNTLVGNSSEETGAGVHGGGGILAEDDALLLNNIVAFCPDGVAIHIAEGAAVTADYNCVFGNADGDYGGEAVAGANDVNADPLLQRDTVHLAADSPCIDAGDPDTPVVDDEVDIDLETRIQNNRVDIGADETAPPVCEGDANGDGVVDPLDSGYVQARFGCNVATGDKQCDAADVNGDGTVDPLDVGYVLARLGTCN